MFNIGFKGGVILSFVLFVITFYVGVVLSTYFFLGILMFIGLVIIIESVSPLKWFVYKCYNAFDLMLFISGVILTFKLGVTISASFIVLNILYSLTYKQWIKNVKKQTA